MSDTPADVTLHVLRDIQARVSNVDAKVTGLDAKLDDVRREVHERFDNLIAVFGCAYRESDRRITHVEVRVDRLEPPPNLRRRR